MNCNKFETLNHILEFINIEIDKYKIIEKLKNKSENLCHILESLHEEDIIRIIEILKTKNIFNINQKFKKNYTYLKYAIKHNYIKLCHYLLNDNNLKFYDYSHHLYLHRACILEDIDIIQKIINKLKINKLTKNNKFLKNKLYYHIANKHLYINIVDKNNFTPLEYYCYQNNNHTKLKIIQILVEHGAYIYKIDFLNMIINLDNHEISKYIINKYNNKKLCDSIFYIHEKMNNYSILHYKYYWRATNILLYICIKLIYIYITKNEIYSTNTITENIEIIIIKYIEIIELILNKINHANNYTIIDNTIKIILDIRQKDLSDSNLINLIDKIISTIYKIESNTKSAAKIINN